MSLCSLFHSMRRPKARPRLQSTTQERVEGPKIHTDRPPEQRPPSVSNRPMFDTPSGGLTDADLHDTLGGELKGDLIIRPEKYSLGSFVDVHRGTWVKVNGEKSEVVVKVLRAFAVGRNEGLNERRRRRLLRESLVWKAVSHQNILPFLGYRLGKDPCMVLPWCHNGNINIYVTNRPELTRAEKIVLLYQASLGLQYLHTLSPPISHGNICPENVLINDMREAVISDFGLSKALELQASGFTTSGDQWGRTSGYLAPELLMSDRTIVETDIYAFGGVILTVLSGLRPHYKILKRGRLIIAVIGGAVPVPADHPGLPHTDPLWEFMNLCWAFEPVSRPSIQQVANTLGRQRKENAQSTISSKSIPSREVLDTVDEGPDVELPDSELDLLAELPGELTHETDENTLRGGFSDVVKGRWTQPAGETVTVAIKYLRTVAMQSSQTAQDKRMDREVLVWRRLKSPYILELYGFRSGAQPCLISPWCKKGTLHDYLKAHPLLTVVDKLELLVRAGKGLQYLHEYSPPISHGDIKPSNILIDDNDCPRLCDFGLSQFLEQANPELQTSFVGQGSKGYQAPELVRDGLQDLSSDVYAFGCIVLEVLSENAPFYKLKAGKALLAISAGSIPEPSAHPKLPPSDPIWDILRKCWAAPSVRPTAKAVVQMLEEEIDRRRDLLQAEP